MTQVEAGLDGTQDVGRAAKSSGGWRQAFLNRPRREDSEDGRAPRRVQVRSASAVRSASLERSEALKASFDSQAMLDQDRALIEQLTQRQSRSNTMERESRGTVKKPPPPPKVTPYRGKSQTPTQQSTAPSTPTGPAAGGDGLLSASAPPTPSAVAAAGGVVALSSDATAAAPPRSDAALDHANPTLAAAGSAAISSEKPCSEPAAPPAADDEALAAKAALGPVVPRAGQLFTASDIDSFMDRLGPSKAGGPASLESGAAADAAAAMPSQAEVRQNFSDISHDFFRARGMEVAGSASLPEPSLPSAPTGNLAAAAAAADARPAAATLRSNADAAVPERKALKEQIRNIDSWLDEDIAAREQLTKSSSSASRYGTDRTRAAAPAATIVSSMMDAGVAGGAVSSADGDCDVAVIIRTLEDIKKKKALGQKVSPVTLKELATKTKPLLPSMTLEQLAQVLRLFTSARYEDHDLYLRTLGEIPMQIRGISPELLVSCLRILSRLRLHEETYVELFSMEAMNMIRAKRRSAPRPPPRPGANRTVSIDKNATAFVNSSDALQTPVPPPREAPSPFSPLQLVQLGNALCQLGSKPPPRFMDIYQAQLAIAIPLLTQEQCEMVCPTLAMSQLMHDPLRRAFLERCAAVDAGGSSWSAAASAAAGQRVVCAPDIALHQLEEKRRRSRAKHFRNIYVIEASVRKETFSFFTSLSAEVRAYLDKLHQTVGQLPHEDTSTLAQQVAGVLDQLGVNCELSRKAGPLGLHVVVKATNPQADVPEIVYECSDATAFYAVRQDDKSAQPEITALARLRHRLLQRLGVQLTQISIWEWKQMSEAQRVNYMVKLQSLL
eukprot:TRINITY_DN101359_c0_g1_i1.p1 TRINITY_DN101359_c0_g1~~TRINITY_DN101359_c0_g1_i1.p1  ORF type:complete len:840 (+),score=216.36 TRINITY_DN101359_c0_g1_i1:119-2638(+)